MSSVLPIVVLLPLLFGTTLTLACGRPSVGPRRRAATALISGLVALAALGLLLTLAPDVFDGTPVLWHGEWVPAIGLDADFRLDGLSLLFAGLITGVGVLIVVYAAWYLGADDPAGKFHAQLMLFMAAMLGVVLADNLLLLVVFWELTSISSFLLVGYWGHRAEARDGARMALAITGGGGLVMLAGVLLLGRVAGTYTISALAAQAAVIQADSRYPLLLGLILVGCFAKSAQFPLHFWLPGAMAAPTPVSAYLHSATMVKAGLFLLMRLTPALGGTPLFEALVAGTGLVTMVFAAVVAIFRHDLKSLLAYSTISQLGLITFLIGLASPLSAVAAVFHVLNHASFKAALFMTAGIVDHETGTRDLRRLGGLYASLPVVGTAAIVAAAAMAGLPPLNGFISKELMLEEALHAGARWGGWASWVVPLAATLGGLGSAAYSLRLVHDTFFHGPARDLPNPHPHEPPFGMKAPVLLLVALCVAVGLAPMAIVGPLVALAAGAMLGTAAPAFELALWHGLTPALGMSAVAVFGGAALYAWLARGRRLHEHAPRTGGGRAVYETLLDGLLRIAGRGTAALENGSLQRYAACILLFALVTAAWPLLAARPSTGGRALLPASPLAVVLWALLLATCGALLRWHRERFVAVVLVGVVGLVTSIVFLAHSAPDLALTQLSVEVVSTVLLLMGLALLPARTPRESSTARRARDAAIALGCGVGVAVLAWLVLTRDHDSIAWYFLERSLPQGGGANVVNVILVDFRGYDTWGEITVLAIAAVGVLALLDRFRVRRDAVDADGRAWSFTTVPLLLRQSGRLVLPLALTVSLYLFWRGHNAPGGGFIAGLVTSVGLVLQYMARGQSAADALLHAAGGARYLRWIAAGLGIASATGLGAFALGHPYLTSASGHPVVPVLGELPLASATLFDLGVYLVVVGATMLMLSVLGAVGRGPTAGSMAQRAAT